MAVRDRPKPPKRPRLPLLYRLPNPPATFVGRATEASALEAAIRRAPVTVVWGLAGLGKTALVLSVLRRAFASRASRALHVALHAGDPPAQMRLEIARAIAAAKGLVDVAWPALAQEPSDLDATLLDLAESSRAWVVLEDLHVADAAWAADLLARLARYARQSRWIVTTRVDPGVGDLAGQVVALGPLADAEIRDLAARLSPSGAPDAKSIARAAGSPLRLHRLLSGAPLEEETVGWLAALDADAVSLVEHLSLVRVALPMSTVEALSGPVSDDVVRTIERRGLAQRTPAGLLLRDVARAAIAGALDPARARAIAARAADVLDASGDAPSSVEAIRLALEAGDVAGGARRLAERAADLVAAGYAPRLWRCLEDATDPRLASFRLQVAVELGDRDVLATLSPPAGAEIADRLAWARALLLRGELDAAERAAAELVDAATLAGETSVAFEAAILRARCLGNRGDYHPMTDLLAALDPPDADGAARRDVLVARCRADLGDRAGALQLADALARRLPEMKPLTRDVVRVGIGVAYFRVGELRRALAVLRESADAADGAQLYIRRQALSLQAGLEIDAGALDAARAHLERLAPFAQGTLHRHFVAVIDAERRLVAGEHAGLDRALDALAAETKAGGLSYVHWQARTIALRLAIQRADRAPDLERPPDEVPAAPYFTLHAAQARARSGQADVHAPPPPDHAELRVLSSIVHADAAVAVGRPADAVPVLLGAIALADTSGYRLREAEARRALCDALAAAERFDQLAATADALAALGREFPSALVLSEAKLFAAVAAPVVDPAVLEELAARDDVAPVASRRARALLGAPTKLDAVDDRVLRAVRRRLVDWRLERLAGGVNDAWRPGWGLDESRALAWLPGGRRAAFAERPLLFRLLEAIALSGGAVTKESIVLRVWKEHEYHPLRHDGRLHAAMHKIRRAIEDDPTAPRRLVTTEDGYAFGKEEPVRWLRRNA